MKLGSIGTSNITRMFLSAAKAAGGIEHTAVYSRSYENGIRFAKETGGCVFTDLLEMAESDLIDAVYIASPNRFHYAQSKVFLEHGKHVLCEKPLTTTKAQEEELIVLAEGEGLVYSEAIMSIHTPAFETLRGALAKIGTVRTANLVFCQLSSRYQGFLSGIRQNIFDPELHAGCLMDIGVYNVYLAAALFGKPREVFSDAVFLSTGADGSGSAVLRYDGLTVNLIYSKVGQNYAPSEIIGDEGTLQIGSVSQLTGIELITKDGTQTLVEKTKTRDEVMGAEAAYFRDTVQNGYNDAYEFAKQTSLTVREITDTIRRQNGFPF